jgi:hypothetical protein
MNLLASKNSWVTAPIFFLIGIVSLIFCWLTTEPSVLTAKFGNDDYSFVEAMTIPLFAAIIPLSWLTTPVDGSLKRKILFSSNFSLLGFIAVARELDWHRVWFNAIWPDIAQGFKGTVFKLNFITADTIPIMPKLFVIAFFAICFTAIVVPLAYYFVRLIKGLFKFHPVCWTVMFLGISGVMSKIFDRLPSMLNQMQIFPPELMEKGTGPIRALLMALEEGGELMVAVLACLAILQAHAIYSSDTPEEKFKEI